mgnify:CR=1 FL=1
MRKQYRGVQIPESLAQKVDRFVKGEAYGYRTFAEFVIDAVRRRVEELEREERFRKVQERKGVWSDIEEP